MTATAPASQPEAANDPRPYQLQPIRAFRAYQKLLADKEDTAQVFEIMRALNGRSTARGYERMIRSVEGGRQAYERVEMAERLADRAYVDSFAEGTVGAAYRHFVRSENLTPDGLVEVSRQVRDDEPDLKHPYAWFGRRIRDVHDIWHVLSGYHRDEVGEACLVAFSFAQTKGLGWGFIAAGAWQQGLVAEGPHPYAGAILEGWKRGRKAAWLPAEDYDRLLNEPLGEARQRLNITEPKLYHAIPPEVRGREAAAINAKAQAEAKVKREARAKRDEAPPLADAA